MVRIIEAVDSQGLIGLSTNLLMVWAALAVSVIGPSLLGATIGGGASGLRDAPWTPPGWFIGAVWLGLYTALGVAQWMLNGVPQRRERQARLPSSCYSGSGDVDVLCLQ